MEGGNVSKNMRKEIEVITLDDTYDSEEESFHTDGSNQNELVSTKDEVKLPQNGNRNNQSSKDSDKNLGFGDHSSINGDGAPFAQPGTSKSRHNFHEDEEDEFHQLVSSEDSLCLNCFGEEPFKDLVQCTAGHFFCQQCFRDYVNDSIRLLGQKCVVCMVPGCNTFFTKELVKKYIPKDLPDVMENSLGRHSKELGAMSPRHSETEDEDAVLGLVMEKFPDVDPKYIATLLPVFQSSGNDMVKDICTFLKAEMPRYGDDSNLNEDTCEDDVSNFLCMDPTNDYSHSSHYQDEDLPIKSTSTEVSHPSLSQTSSILEEIRKSLPFSHEFTITPVTVEKNIKAMPTEKCPVNLKRVPSLLPTSNESSSLQKSHQSVKCKKSPPVCSQLPVVGSTTRHSDDSLQNRKTPVDISTNSLMSTKRTKSDEITTSKLRKLSHSSNQISSEASSKHLPEPLNKSNNSVSRTAVDSSVNKDKSHLSLKQEAVSKQSYLNTENSASQETSLTKQSQGTSEESNAKNGSCNSDNKSTTKDDDSLAIPGPSGISVSPQNKHSSEEDYECQCCYNNVPFDYLVQCTEGHLFCCECLKKYTEESVFGQGQAKLLCMTDGCVATFPTSQLKRALPETVMKKYEERVTEESLNLASLKNLVRCPYCKFGAELGEEENAFHCQNSSCQKVTCRKCKIDWEKHEGVKCEELAAKDEQAIRLTFEEKMSKARIRECPSCKTKYTKDDGCNKITCRCGTSMCYICRLPVKDYSHFCEHRRNGKNCCTKCSACPLWSNDVEDDKRAIAELKQYAQVVRKKTGFTENKAIGAPDFPEEKAAHKHLPIQRAAHNHFLLRLKWRRRRQRYNAFYRREYNPWRRRLLTATGFRTT